MKTNLCFMKAVKRIVVAVKKWQTDSGYLVESFGYATL